MTSDELRALADAGDLALLAGLDICDAARLLADAIDALDVHTQYCEARGACTCGGYVDVERVLERFAAL